MKTINDISRKEVKLSETLLEIFKFEVRDGYIYTKDIVPVIINNRYLKMINRGDNTINDNECLFRPLLSSSICTYLLNELYELDDTIEIYLCDEPKNFSVRILNEDKTLASFEKNNDYNKCILMSIINFYYAEEQEYCEKIKKIIQNL